MWDLLSRALKHPRDYLGIFSTQEIEFIEHVDEGNGSYSFLFKPKETLSWKAGQHGVFTMPNQNVTGIKWRAFSIASATSEGVIRIGTIIPEEPSDFKQKLRALQPGDTIMMRGPFGEFHASDTVQQIVGIAGGIGITPLRAIGKEIVSGVNTFNSLHLIYAGKDGYYCYGSECETMESHPKISVSYTNTIDETNSAIENAIETYGNNATYNISGSPGMIAAIKKKLESAGIKNIINDPFKGY